jgi:hypothetical protein
LNRTGFDACAGYLISTGVGVEAVSATVFSPGGAPDKPQKAGLVIDGNPRHVVVHCYV